MIIFFVIFLVIIALMDLFVVSRWKKYCISKGYNKIFYFLPYSISGVMFLLFAYSNYFNFMVYPVPNYIKWFNIVTSFWYLPKVLIVPVLIIIELVKYFKRLAKGQRGKEVAKVPLSVNNSRRKIVGNIAWGVAGVPFLMAAKGLAHTVYDLKIFRENIFLPKLPLQLNGLRIVQISDMHFGTYMSSKPLDKLKDVINALKPDLIFITGDFVNFRYEELDNGEEFLRNLQSVYGTYACLGNHDHYMPVSDHEKLVKRIRNTGVRLLINENRVLKIRGAELNLASVDNYGSRQTFGDFDKAYEGLPEKNVTILLSHDPKTWESHVLGKRKTELTLSGHTHGGQVALEFLGVELSFAKAVYKHYKGLYNEGEQYLYVNRGIGVSGPPIRLNINPEVTLITLKKPTNMV